MENRTSARMRRVRVKHFNIAFSSVAPDRWGFLLHAVGRMPDCLEFDFERCSLPDNASGTHKQREHGKGDGSSKQPPPKSLDHAFVTPRVKSAAKSRQAVSLLNQIVGEKDTLLKDAIQGMERKDKALLTSKNNDFLKFVSSSMCSARCSLMPYAQKTYVTGIIARILSRRTSR